MDVITMTRELGKVLQQDERYAKLMRANAANDACADLQEKIGRFSALRGEVNKELMNPEKDQAKLSQMDTELRAMYAEVMETPEMQAYNEAKVEMESLLSFMMQIITDSAAGVDPDLIEQKAGCSGGCSSCDGCH